MTSEELPKVSILLVTYNHSKYINAALRGIDTQDYRGAIELVVNDDCSSDDTVALVQSYQFQNRKINVRILNNASNLGITKNYKRGFNACDGEYIAVLEGDDMWTSPHRLSKMIEVLHSHHECVMVCSNYFIQEEESHKFTSRTSVDPSGFWRIDSRYLIHNNLPGNFSACIYRKDTISQIPAALYELKAYDWILNICVGMHGLIAYLHEPLSIYRLHKSGSWSGMQRQEQIESQIEMIECYDILTKGAFKQEFEDVAATLRNQLLVLNYTPHFVNSERLPSIKRAIVQLAPPIVIKLIQLLVPPFVMNRLRGALN